MMPHYNNRNRSILLAVLFSLLFSISAFATERGGVEEAPLLTLEECIASALENNFSISIAQNRVRIAENNRSLEPFLPSINLSSRFSDDRGGEKNYTATEDIEQLKFHSTSISNGVSLSWRIFDGLAMFATREIQEKLLREGQYNLRASIENLVLAISSQYYKIITLHNQVELLTELVSISSIRYNQALTRYNIGSDSGLEYKQAKIYLNSDSSSLMLQRENLKNAYIELYSLMNQPYHSNYRVKDTIIPERALELPTLIEAANQFNTQLTAARVGESLAESNLKLTRAQRYPTLDLSAGYNYNFNRNQYIPSKFNEGDRFNWGVTLSIPIFNGGELSRRVANAQIERESAQLFVRQAEVELEGEIRQLYNLYRNHLLSIEFEEESRESAYLNLEAAMAKYKLGALAGIEFRDYQISYLSAADRKLKALYDTKLAEIRLQLLAGTLFDSLPLESGGE